MKIKILKDSRDGSFQGQDGEPVPYFWTKAVRASDDVSIEFGGKVAHKAGEVLDLDIEKTERAGGRFGYKEIVETE